MTHESSLEPVGARELLDWNIITGIDVAIDVIWARNAVTHIADDRFQLLKFERGTLQTSFGQEYLRWLANSRSHRPVIVLRAPSCPEAYACEKSVQFLRNLGFAVCYTDVEKEEPFKFTRGKAKRADYILYYEPNIPIAIIEAKDNNHSVGDGIHKTGV